MKELLSTKEVAKFLGINEKMVYTLISEKGLPATKATGKWLFPRHLVEQWVESKTINYPKQRESAPVSNELLVVAGSNDILFDTMLRRFMDCHEEYLATFANLGSLGGIKALRKGLCHMATSHLMQKDGEDYNFGPAEEELGEQPAIINFSYREQGFIVPAGNPAGITCAKDIADKQLTVVNRPVGTGTRLLFDTQLEIAGASPQSIRGYTNEVQRHLDVGIEVLSGRADAGPAIRTVATQLGLGFVPVQWERFDLIVPKKRYFDKIIQQFVKMLADEAFHALAKSLTGYDTTDAGRVIFPGENIPPSE